MQGDDGAIRSFQMIIRVHGEETRITRALMHEVTDVSSPRLDSDLALARFAARMSDHGVGYVELASALIYEWASDPAPPLHRWVTERPRFHPDDLTSYRAACHEMFRGEPGDTRRELVFRLRFADTEWIAVQAELMRFGDDMPHGLIRVWPVPSG